MPLLKRAIPGTLTVFVRDRAACPGSARYLDNRKRDVRVQSERLGLWPKVEYTKEDALHLQLKSLQINNTPYRDHGIEVLYRFADFDPFERSRYFGKSLDLGQFERFRRVFFTPWFQPLVGYSECTTLSQLSVSNCVWKTRLLIRHGLRGEQDATYEITMVYKDSGIHQGLWLTNSVIRDDIEGTQSFL